MEKPSFLSLSDEVLLDIFSYLDGIDKINTYCTCIRFRNVICDRVLSRKLKLMGNYKVTLKDVKFYLKLKVMRQNIRILDLTNCYWLQPSEVCTTVVNLKNLIAFYSVDVAFTSNQLVKILNQLPKLRCLSFSWPETTAIENINEHRLDSLVFLYIYFPKLTNINWSHVFHWIFRWKRIKDLWLISSPGINPVRDLHTLSSEIPLRGFLFDTLVIVGFKTSFLWQNARSVCMISTDMCKCVWLPGDRGVWRNLFRINADEVDFSHLTTLMRTYLENYACKDHRVTLGKEGKAKRLYWNLHKPPFYAGDEQIEDLEELQIKYCFPLNLLEPLHMLTVLCIVTCCFSGPGSLNKETKLLPKWCPEIQHFELDLCRKCNKICQDSSLLLEMIAEWPKLKTLKLLDCWNLRSGKGFDKIFRSCKNLENLCLKNVGALHGYVFEFTKALKNCKNLKHFRFEERYVPSLQLRWIFEALPECPLIERVAVIFQQSDSSPTNALVLNLIEKLPNLIFLCITTSSMVEAQKKKLMKTITERFTPTRPALCCYFLKSLENSEKYKLPAVHLFEMLYADTLGPLQLPYRKDFFFEVPNLDVTAIESMADANE